MSDALIFERSAEADALVAADDVASAMIGRTFRHHDPFHGTQFEYYAPDHTAFLWYPGNDRSVASAWSVKGQRTAEGDERQICFVYGPRIFNPVTQTWGGRPECEPIEKQTLFVKESVEGDVFDLESGNVPWILIGEVERTMAEYLNLHRSPLRWGRRY